MPITWSDLTKWDPQSLVDAYEQVRSLEASMESNEDAFWRAKENTEGQGSAADAARETVQLIIDDMRLAETQFTELMIRLNNAAFDVEDIARRVLDVLAVADTCLLTVDSDGTVDFRQEMWDAAAYEAAQWPAPQPSPMASGETSPWTPEPSDLSKTAVYDKAVEGKSYAEELIASVLADANRVDDDLVQAFSDVEQLRLGDASSSISGSGTSTDELLATLEGASSVKEVRALWDALDPATQTALISAFPLVIGALNGIPFADRKRANDINAAARVDALTAERNKLQADYERTGDPNTKQEIDDLQQEINYLNEVLTAPDRGFVLFDAEQNRIIEMNGSIKNGTDEVYIHVPGTRTKYASFVDGSVSDFPIALREEAAQQNMDIATFTYMDGGYTGEQAWIEWGNEDGRANSNGQWLAEKGKELAEFSDAVLRESLPVGADLNIGGHSAGMGTVFHAEQNGARFDQVVSISGSSGFQSDSSGFTWSMSWEPYASTEYDHVHYTPEFIHLVPGSPYHNEAFEDHAFPGSPNPVENHSRVDSGDESNREVRAWTIRQFNSSGQRQY